MKDIIAWGRVESFDYGDCKGKLPVWLSGLLDHAGIFRLLPDGSVLYKNEEIELFFCDGGLDLANIDANAKREIYEHCLPSLHDSFPQLNKPFTGRIVFKNESRRYFIEEVRIRPKLSKK